jgi:hypothetical protein
MGMICEVFAVSAEQIREFAADPDGVHEVLDSLAESDQCVSLEKSWHGLHYVFTQTAWEGEPPLNFLAAGGEPIGEDGGFGPCRWLRNDEVRALDAALDGFTQADFDRRFDLRELEANEIYPQIWDEPLEELKEEYGEYLSALKELVKRAARGGEALVIAVR